MKRRAKFSIITIGTVLFGVFVEGMVGTSLNPGSDNKQVAKGEEIDDVTNAEVVIIDSMHKMTHQKVMANEKNGFIAMSPDNIKKLRQLVNNSDMLTDKEKYSQILDHWEKGDFSQAIEEHNDMWERAGGNTHGKAYRLATSEEEKAYLEEQSTKEQRKENH
ncbi:DUF6241 domain-containing protein [Bacillus pseudomycoides]|uniref:DUF6241 domain-containing protein n=1 Tax=Bacillus pseudomycoides TaxID=64104 RepID=UPI000BEB9F4B|nr:DUF6241 domain-containing protein [Bacillus pseudomycoides]PED07215.1 hypothetical protein COO19_16570 [Bacillus pseudomycoides]PEK11476.1 hypothetical protein CN693_26190 [Bacillus pseudomycoides]PEO21567.1 hypothetical protein CN542_10350 [Bacillus pseudomycoides]PEP68286.1 hypothetical protein CN591_09125 [Bacillus pseudomycoides]PFW69202.1 hypothetical protein COL25_08930 [Bacillus pseudomycoides]